MIRLFCAILLLLPISVMAQDQQEESAHHHHDMAVDDAGVVMNENKDTLPRGCDSISTDHNLEIYVGRE